ncbi:MAG: hypothetical protein GF344_02565, partial [Chitinivibrionales bacterium]|nr:hypothetical protein [Chitinivibrionales bacterium]
MVVKRVVDVLIAGTRPILTSISLIPAVLLCFSCQPGTPTDEEAVARFRAEIDSLRALVQAMNERMESASGGLLGARDSLSGGAEDVSAEMSFALSVIASRVDSLGRALAAAERRRAADSREGGEELNVEELDQKVRRIVAAMPRPEPRVVESGGTRPASLKKQSAYRVGPDKAVSMSKARQVSAGILVGTLHAGRNGRGVLSANAGGATTRASVHWKDFGGNQNVFCTDNSFVLPVPANTGWEVSAYQWDGQVEGMVYWYPI